jgi:excisionase family DNA binding protein
MADHANVSKGMSTKEAATALDLSVWTVARLVAARKLDARNVSAGRKRRRLRIDPASVEAFKSQGA